MSVNRRRATVGCASSGAVPHDEMSRGVQGLSVIARNAEFVKLAAALMVASFVQAGLMDIEAQYLLTLFGFDQLDFAQVFMLIGVGMLVVQVNPLPLPPPPRRHSTPFQHTMSITRPFNSLLASPRVPLVASSVPPPTPPTLPPPTVPPPPPQPCRWTYAGRASTVRHPVDPV